MHLQRLISAVIILPLIYLYLSKLPSPFFAFALAALCALAHFEFNSMYKLPPFVSAISIICGLAIVLSHYIKSELSVTFDYTLLVLTVLVLFLSIWRLFAVSNPEGALRDIAPAIIGCLYISVLLSYQWLLYQSGYEWIIFLYGTVWTSDSAAYYIGKSIGKKKLYESVSPNKTKEGAYASLVGGVFGGIILGLIFLKGHEMTFMFVAGIVIGTITIVGDLVESVFKRDAGIKDSGTLIPGHGGFLDKIDGALFAGPALFALKMLY